MVLPAAWGRAWFQRGFLGILACRRPLLRGSMILGLILCCCTLAVLAGTVEGPTSVPELRRVDVVLGCSYVGEGGLPRAFGGSQHPATLVLRGLSVTDDGTLGDVTNYEIPQEDRSSSPPIIFEASAQLVSIPHAEALLHVDCSGEEVICELSPYSSRQEGYGICSASWFLATVRLSSGISIALLLRGPSCSSQKEEGHGVTLHPKLRIPVSKEGILLTTVEFQSSSNNTSLRTRLGSSITLDCHFALAPGFLLSSLEWRRQHRGSGRSLFRYNVGSAGPTVQPKVHVDVEQLLGSGDASLTLQEAAVDDEGTYICLVSTTQHQVQHNIQLLVAEPPRVRVFPAEVSFKRDETITLTCNIAGYYPLDISVNWIQKTPEDEVEISLSNARFSSHRQSRDGTYSITSYLSISSATVQAPATYTCHVSHVALEEPISVSTYLKAPEHTESEGLIGGAIATAIFVSVLFIVLRKKRAAEPKPEQLLTASE
ncbi:tapasin-related protein isoform X1 [Numida meleagris]|uniref:tapasin-related protein isoform X1 n=1 Tax=Numida meleagris TaxID=8996 RepID=UPI000B3DE2AE|nr:tapasin-related protein isoform X1 [Numida meleagris]